MFVKPNNQFFLSSFSEVVAQNISIVFVKLITHSLRFREYCFGPFIFESKYYASYPYRSYPKRLFTKLNLELNIVLF